MSSRSLVVRLDENCGRVLVTEQVFNVGETVLEEAPLIQYSSLFQLLILYSRLSDKVKNKILDMQSYLSTDEARYNEFRRKLDELKSLIDSSSYQFLLQSNNIDNDLAFRILSISYINSHGYEGANLDRQRCSDVDGSSYSALFELASKAVHSCSPNCNYSSKSKRNSLTYYATQPIACGDQISFCYLDLSSVPTHIRRKRLMETKDFFCQCSKCMAPDFEYGFKCTYNDNCSGVKLCVKISESSETSWRCQICRNNEMPDFSPMLLIHSKHLEMKKAAKEGSNYLYLRCS